MGLKKLLLWGSVAGSLVLGGCGKQKKVSEQEIRDVLSPKRNTEEFHPVFTPYHCVDTVTRDRIYDGLKALRLRRDIPPYQQYIDFFMRDQDIYPLFVDFLKENGFVKSDGGYVVSQKAALSFLLKYGIATNRGNVSIIKQQTKQALRDLDLLDVCGFGPEDSVNVYVNLSQENGGSSGFASIYPAFFVGRKSMEDRGVYYNEATAIAFDEIVKDLDRDHPDVFTDEYGSARFTNLPISDELSQYQNQYHETEVSEYYGDLINLMATPETHLSHMLQYAVMLDGIQRSFLLSDNPEKGLGAGIQEIQKEGSTYVLTKPACGEFLLSQELLGMVLYKEGEEKTLRDVYNKQLDKEAERQFKAKILDTGRYITVGKNIAKRIAENPEAMEYIKREAAKRFLLLQKYLEKRKKTT